MKYTKINDAEFHGCYSLQSEIQISAGSLEAGQQWRRVGVGVGITIQAVVRVYGPQHLWCSEANG